MSPSSSRARTHAAPSLTQSTALGLSVLGVLSLAFTTTLVNAQIQFPEIPGATPVFGGFVVSPFDPLTIQEEGSGQMDVVLINGPSQPATITITPSDPGLVTVSPSTLSFDRNNWSILQPVQVTSLADDNNNTDSVTLSFQISTASPEFVGMEVQTRTVVINDTSTGNGNGNNGNGNGNGGNNGNNGNGNGNGNNGNGNGNGGNTGGSNPGDDNNDAAQAGFTVTPNSVLSVNEGSFLTGAYDVVLNSDPGGMVKIKVDSNNPNSLTVNGQGRTELMFDSSDWNQAKQVSVEGVEDGNVNDEQVNITFDVLEGPNAYLNLANQSRQVNTIDNDGNSNNDGDNNNDGNDDTDTGSTGGGVGGSNPDDDNNEAAMANLVINPLDTTDVNEGVLEPDLYDVALASAPGGAVMVEVTSSDADRVMFGASGEMSAQMMFDDSNWNIPQFLSILTLEDDDTTDDTVALTFDVISGPSDYDDLDSMFRSIRVLDNDMMDDGDTDDDTDGDDNDNSGGGVGGSNPDEDNNDGAMQGLMITPEQPFTIFEGESVPAAFDVMLMSQPTGPVSVMVQSNDPEALMLNMDNMLTLNFDATNWNVPQSLDIEGVEDEDMDDEITFLAFDASGSDYDDLENVLRTVNVTDNDMADNGGDTDGDDDMNNGGGVGGANPDEDNNDANDGQDNGDEMSEGDDMETPDTGFGGANPDADNNDADMDGDMMDQDGAIGGTAKPAKKTAGAKGLIRTGGASDLSAYALITFGTLLLAGSLSARALARVRRD